MDLLPVDTALDCVLRGASAVPAESIALATAGGRILAEPVVAERTQPSFDASAMDGYAFKAADSRSGARFRLVGEAAAGKRFEGILGTGEAIRIFTGAPLPEGADTVLIQEDAKVEQSELVVGDTVETARHVRPAGSDFNIGDLLLPKGRELGARELALAAAANRDTLLVVRKPRVAVLSIGNELALPGSELEPDQIVASNSAAIVEIAERAGASTQDLGLAPDRVERVADAAKAAAEIADVLVTIGGASVGDHDVARPALAAAGMTLDFWRIAMRPGKPLVFGRLGDMKVLGLPGNPVSSFVCGLIFLRPLVRSLLGLARDSGEEPALLGVDMPPNSDRTTFLRARLVQSPDRLPTATPLPRQDSSLLTVLAEANCFLVRPANAEASPAGATCTVMRL